jgi:hypothetical protein
MMHFEPEKGQGAYSVIELRTDTKLAAQLVATSGGLQILIAQGFGVAAGSAIDGREISMVAAEIHIEIRERES